MPARRQTPWRADHAILERLTKVEALALDGLPNTAIAAQLGVDEITIRRDRKRLQELWLESVGGDVRKRRAARITQLEHLADKALRAADFDEKMERAVLLGESMGTTHCPGNVEHVWGLCPKPHIVELTVQRDAKGSAMFRGNKAGSLNAARQALMDAAKLEGLVVDKQDVTSGGMPVTFTLRIDRGDSEPDATE